jgi:hypothetical protein
VRIVFEPIKKTSRYVLSKQEAIEKVKKPSQCTVPLGNKFLKSFDLTD